MNRWQIAILWLGIPLLTNCTGQSVEYKVSEFYPKKNPHQMHFYSQTKEPIAPYKIIGVAKIAKYNVLGVKRDQQQLHDMMKQLAAEMGGDAILNLEDNPSHVRANIIAYQRILL